MSTSSGCRARPALWLFVALLLSSCSANSPADACARGELYESASIRMESAVNDLDRTTSVELRAAVSNLVDQVAILREVSPRALRDPLGILLAAHGQLAVALERIDWNPTVGLTDPLVAAARSAFGDQSVVEAGSVIAAFFVEQCQLALSERAGLFAVTGTTLPLPEPGEEARLDATEEDDPSSGELRALGLVIGDRYGVVLGDVEAECVARVLGTRFSDATDIAVEDEEYFAIVRGAFATCGISSPPVTTTNN